MWYLHLFVILNEENLKDKVPFSICFILKWSVHCATRVINSGVKRLKYLIAINRIIPLVNSIN